MNEKNFERLDLKNIQPQSQFFSPNEIELSGQKKKNKKLINKSCEISAGFRTAKKSLTMNSKTPEDSQPSENYVRRACSLKRPAESDETKNSESEDEDSFDSGSEADNPADEDFSLKAPKKKRKKKKKKLVEKERRPRAPKNVRRVPTFDEVMNAQIQHSFRYTDYDLFESETSSNIDEADEQVDELPETEEVLDERPEAGRSRSETPEPPRFLDKKKKRIIIYPWNPIGITGGRPVSDVSKL